MGVNFDIQIKVADKLSHRRNISCDLTCDTRYISSFLWCLSSVFIFDLMCVCLLGLPDLCKGV